jgi:hypothetical protein
MLKESERKDVSQCVNCTQPLFHNQLLGQCVQALGKTSIADRQWTAKQFWVDRQTFKQKDDIYRLERVQIVLEERQLRWFGHVHRMERERKPKQFMEAPVEGRKQR